MEKRVKIARRGFMKAVGLASAAAQSGLAQDGPKPQEPNAAATPVTRARAAFEYPRTFSGRHLEMLSFPLGGVGAGCLGLGGRGQLRNWEMFNRPDKGRAPGYAFPSIWVQSGSAPPVARVLEARLMPPYEAASGLNPSQVSGLTRLEEATFTGEYPLARISFHDRTLPVKIRLEAFTPIVPHDAEDSGLPVAVLRYRVSNAGRQRARVSIAFSLDNPAGVDLRARGRGNRPLLSKRMNEFRSSPELAGLFMTNPETPENSPLAGSFAVGLLGAGDGKVTYLRGWPRAKWWASPLLFWDDFSTDGELGPEAPERNAVGSLCLEREIARGSAKPITRSFWPGISRTVRLPGAAG